MTDLKHLEQLLLILRESNVSIYKDGSLSLQFHAEQKIHPVVKSEDKDQLIDMPIDEAQLPVDLRTDNITDYDKVLMWSGSPDQESDLPLTGDAPLEGI